MKNKKVLVVMALAATLLVGCGRANAAPVLEQDVVTDADFSTPSFDTLAKDIDESVSETITEVSNEASTTEISEAAEDSAVETPVTEAASITEDVADEDVTDEVAGATAKTFEEELADALVAKTNEYRTELGLNELSVTQELIDAAEVRAKELPARWSHTRPDGSDWYTVNDQIMYGENLSKGYDTADEIMTAWKESPAHNDNLVNNQFNQIGIFVFVDQAGVVWVAQEFNY